MRIGILISTVLFCIGVFTGILIKVEVDRAAFGNDEVVNLRASGD